MGWLKNLKKWQRGGLIGCAVGLFFSLFLSTLLLTALNTPLRDWIVWAYLFHSWPLYAYAFGIYDILPLSYTIVLPALIFSLTVLYAGLGAIWGLIWQIKKVEWRLLFSFVFVSFMVIYYSINVVQSLGILLY